jgi:hypothetical protein
MVALPSEFEFGEEIQHRSIEGQPSQDVWSFPNELQHFCGVISQSVTVACEAVLSGTPTLLFSGAERGFLDECEGRGLLFRVRSESIPSAELESTIQAWRQAVSEPRNGALSSSSPAVVPSLERLIGAYA